MSRRERDRCLFGTSGPHALGGLIRHHGVMNGLGPLPVFDERKLHFQVALFLSLNVFDRNFHSRLCPI
jgi:hypothetical protein